MSRTTPPPHLLLHDLIGALSYWGTTVRMLLVGFLLLIANILVLLDGSVSHTITEYAAQYLYLLGSLFVLDAGYVTVARALPLSVPALDKMLFFTVLILLSLLVILPYFVVVTPGVVVSLKWIFLVSLFVLALRLVVGMFFGTTTHKK